MRALIQRVLYSKITINGNEKREAGPGLFVLLGVSKEDTVDICPKLADKCANLRIFDDSDGKLNLSAVDKGYSAMIVSNFTLYGDTGKGKRPSFTKAAGAQQGEEIYKEFVACMEKQGLKAVETGEFGADMQIEIVNDGPVTILLDTEEWQRS